MFGHQDKNDNDHHHHDDGNEPIGDVLNHQAMDGMLSDEDREHPAITTSHGFNPALPASDADQPTPASGAPSVDAPAPADEPVTVSPTPANDAVAPALSGAAADALLAIKQQALTQLSPLVDHLDQSPEEKFRTTMMMIQASDNRDLIQTAYDAAQSIADEKIKAQALLDIVNEINYFTQQTA